MVAAFHSTVDEVIAVAEVEGFHADIHRTQELAIATNAYQFQRLAPELKRLSHWGDDRSQVESEVQLRARVAIPSARGALVTSGVARIQPAKFVRGLADAVARLGVTIYETTRAHKVSKGQVITDQGRVACAVVLKATEGYSAQLPGYKRNWLPLNSAQIVTEPLPPELWRDIGWSGAELIGDMAHAYCYCQRTADGRIALGGRGLPYLLNSKIQQDGRPTSGTIAELRGILACLVPAATNVPLAHAWQGVLGVPRDWCATVGLDRETKIGWAGGYVGVGLTSANLAGRTLRDLVLSNPTALTELPWVNRAVRAWEREPLRWMAVRGLYAVLKAADRAEADCKAYAPHLARIGAWIKSQ